MPTYLERLAFASVLAHVRNHVEDYPTYTVLGLRNLANAALDGIAPHFAAKDARIAELLGEVARLRAELDGRRFVQEDVTFERTADAASGADEVAR